LLNSGVLEETAEGKSTGGRPPIKLRYRPESRLAIGMVMFNGNILAALTDMDGAQKNYLEIPVNGSKPEAMLLAMNVAAEKILADTSRDNVLGVGVGAPGIVDFENGIIDISVSQGWLDGGIEVKAYLERALQLPVYVTNRSRVAALGEYQVGVGQKVSALVYMFIGKGIAAGITVNGDLYHGHNSGAGEAGHISVDPDGPLCARGNRGCLEVYASEAAITAQARAAAREHKNNLLHHKVGGDLERLTADIVIEAALRGDVAARSVLFEAGTKVGFVISILIDLFAPEMITIGGPIGTKAGPLILQPAIKEAQLRTLPRSFKATRIVTGELGDKAGAIGAAVMVIHNTPINLLFGD
jgi:glucokinase